MSNSSFVRSQAFTLRNRLEEPRRFIQVVAGARQVGKTTLVRQVSAGSGLPTHFASADSPTLRGDLWVAQQWEAARALASDADARGALLVLDEAQKITDWSEEVKRLWDEDSASGLPLKVVLLGSAPLLVQQGLTESLAGRFELLHLPHWSFSEMRQAFGWDLETYLFYGAYPGAAPLVDQPNRWAGYVRDSLIETTLSRDVLLMNRVDKPALLRRLFDLGCRYSGQILSYNKMLGQLQDAGNTTTLAHYLELLSGVGMLTGLQKYSGAAVRSRASSPKLQVMNTALMTALSGLRLEEAREDRAFWGRLAESAVGAHLANGASVHGFELYYWRHRNREVDFVARLGRKVTAIEVKSGPKTASPAGMTAFVNDFRPQRSLLIGGDGIAIENFLSKPAKDWLD